MIIDCDIHVGPSEACPLEPFVSPSLRQACRQHQDTSPANGYRNPIGVNRRDVLCQTPADVINSHLDIANISYGVLQPQPGMYSGLIHNIDVANGMAQACNDWLIETYLKADERFLGSICVCMADPRTAAAEIRRVGNHPRMVQVVVPGESLHLYGHRSFDPVYEACCELGVPFALHPGAEGAFHSSTPIGRPSSYFEWHSSLPLTFQAHLGSLVAEGTFEKFPDLRVVLVEGGIGWLPSLLWRLDKNFKALRSTVPWLKEPPSAYILRHCRLTTQPVEEPTLPEHLAQIYAMVNAEQTVCFSTDFPHWDFDDPSHAFPSKIPEPMRRRILYDNAAELYGLPCRTEMAEMTSSQR